VAKSRNKAPANSAVKDSPTIQLRPITEIEKETKEMPRGPKQPSTAKSVYVKFTEEDDLALYNRLAADAKSDRRDLDLYILLVLHKAYPASEEVEQEEVTK